MPASEYSCDNCNGKLSARRIAHYKLLAKDLSAEISDICCLCHGCESSKENCENFETESDYPI